MMTANLCVSFDDRLVQNNETHQRSMCFSICFRLTQQNIRIQERQGKQLEPHSDAAMAATGARVSLRFVIGYRRCWCRAGISRRVRLFLCLWGVCARRRITACVGPCTTAKYTKLSDSCDFVRRPCNAQFTYQNQTFSHKLHQSGACAGGTTRTFDSCDTGV